jgi:hypothetical protein
MSENKEIPETVAKYFSKNYGDVAESVEELGPYDLSPYMASGKGDTGMSYYVSFGKFSHTGYPIALLYCPEKDTVMEAPTFMAFDLLDQYGDDSEE